MRCDANVLYQQVVGGGSEEIIADLAIRQETALARKKGWKLWTDDRCPFIGILDDWILGNLHIAAMRLLNCCCFSRSFARYIPCPFRMNVTENALCLEFRRTEKICRFQFVFFRREGRKEDLVLPLACSLFHRRIASLTFSHLNRPSSTFSRTAA